MSEPAKRLAAAFREIGRAVAKARTATRQDYALCGAESNADAPTAVSAATEAQGTPHDPAECIPCWSRAKHQEGSQ